MKILLVNKFFYPHGGADAVFLRQRDYLKSIGFQVVDFSMKSDKNEQSDFSRYFVQSRDYHDANDSLSGKAATALALIHSSEAVRQITRLIADERPDIMHCHNVYHQLTPSVLSAAKRSGVPTVLTLHDYKVVCPIYSRLRGGVPCTLCEEGDFFNVVRHRCCEGSFGKSALLYGEAIFHRMMKSYEAVDRVVVPSQFMADAVTRWRFPKDRVSLIYNGVDPDNYPVSEGRGEYFLFLGRLSPEKGLLTLGKAQALTGLPVVVAGTGPMEAVLRSDYPGLRLAGFQSGAALASLVAGAAAVVVPSEWHENCPLSVLEAMAAGKPVIGSRMGGIPELIADGETGLLFDQADVNGLAGCMRRLFADGNVRQAMGLAARDRVNAKFSLEVHYRDLLALYRDLLK